MDLPVVTLEYVQSRLKADYSDEDEDWKMYVEQGWSPEQVVEHILSLAPDTVPDDHMAKHRALLMDPSSLQLIASLLGYC